MPPDRSPLADKAIEVLRENDRGAYTVPTKGLYPFQWNWDSCLTALGQQHIDERRAWTEVETLLYPVSNVAARYGASASKETSEPDEAYAGWPGEYEPLRLPWPPTSSRGET